MLQAIQVRHPPRGSASLRKGLLVPAAALLTLVLGVAQTGAQTKKAPGSPAPPKGVEIRVTAQPEECTVGDPVNIDFEILLPGNLKAVFPPPGDQAGEFTILDFHPGPGVPEPGKQPGSDPPGVPGQPADDRTIHHTRVVAAVYRVGDFEFPPLPLTFTAEDGKEVPAQTPGVKVRVRTVLTETDQQLKDLKKQAEIQEPVQWVFWLAVALSLLILAALAWWWWARSRRGEIPVYSQPGLDPLDLADVELRDLLHRGLLEKGFVKQFYVALSDIVKKILEAGYQIQTVEKTSGEILRSLRDSGKADNEANLMLIEALLRSCDLVKFAKYVPSRPENEKAVRSTQELLSCCRKMRTPSEVPAAAAPAGTV